MGDRSESDSERFVYDEPCDDCGRTPTAYIGDIYYACQEHAADFEERELE